MCSFCGFLVGQKDDKHALHKAAHCLHILGSYSQMERYKKIRQQQQKRFYIAFFIMVDFKFQKCILNVYCICCCSAKKKRFFFLI